MIKVKDRNFRLLDDEEPLLGKHLSLLWGKPEFAEYMTQLLASNATLTRELRQALEQLSSQHSADIERIMAPAETQISESNLHYALVMNKFPRIGRAIALFWGQTEFAPYIASLLHDTRDCTREGFPFDVASSLLELQQLHDTVFPHLAPKSTDPWV